MSKLLLKIPQHEKVCKIIFAAKIEPVLVGELKRMKDLSKIMIVTDRNVRKLYGNKLQAELKAKGFQVCLISIKPGESSKSLKVFSVLLEKCFKCGLDRQSCIIALGGGVAGDLGGYLAASYMRGIRLIQVPTTLLAMVDSSIGGKCGVNLAQGKNICGAFYQANEVIITSHFLETLPARELSNGLAEIVKYAVIADAGLFRLLETKEAKLKDLPKLIQRCVEIKAEIVSHDEREQKGLRQKLNYGHSFAHAIETLTNYRELTHGEAVAIGMTIAAKLAYRKGLINENLLERQQKLLKAFNLPTSYNLKLDALLLNMRRDKKNTQNTFNLILPTSIGRVKMVKLKANELQKLLSA